MLSFDNIFNYLLNLIFYVRTTQEIINKNTLKQEATNAMPELDLDSLYSIRNEFLSRLSKKYDHKIIDEDKYNFFLNSVEKGKLGYLSLKTTAGRGKYPIAIIQEMDKSSRFIFLQPVKISAKYFPGYDPHEVYDAPNYGVKVIEDT